MGLDRTYLAVRRQLSALPCAHYEIGIRDRQGRMLTRRWSSTEVLKAVPWLKRENAKGADIYLRPAGPDNQGFILLDDLTAAALKQLDRAGLQPAVVLETSPHNYQAWIRLTDPPRRPAVATAASKALAAQFNADPHSADGRHFGRLAGFTNRKPAHTTPDGTNPWVLCHQARGQPAPRGPEIVQAALQMVEAENAQAERKVRLARAQGRSARLYRRDPVLEYHRQLKRLTARYGPSLDVSKADWMILTDMAQRGYRPEQLYHALAEASPELPLRKAGHEHDYCQRTVQAVLAQPAVQQAQQAQPRPSDQEAEPDDGLER